MKPEDKYTAAVAGGAGLSLAGLAAASQGARMRREGRVQARANSGSRGDAVRGGRLFRAGSASVAEGREGLGQFRRVKGANGKTVYMKPGGGFAPSKQFTSMIEQGKDSVRRGGQLAFEAKGKRARAVEGLSAMKRGRLVRRGGIGVAVAGGVAALGAGAAGERFHSKRTQRREAARSFVPVARQQELRRLERVNGY